MLTRSLASRLDFDMRILSAAILTPAINTFTTTLLRTASFILDLPHLLLPPWLPPTILSKTFKFISSAQNAQKLSAIV